MAAENGYVKIYRHILDNPIVCKDNDYFRVWLYLLLSAAHKGYPAVFNGSKIELKAGQLITGRNSIAKKCNISESKAERILKAFKIEQQIEQQTSNKNRLVTILNWDKYQKSEQQNEQQVNNNRTTNEQQVDTNKNVKNVEKVNNYNICSEITEIKENDMTTCREVIDYLNDKAGTNYKYSSKDTQEHINARINEGFTLDDFKKVIDNKCDEWTGTEMQIYIRPQTLFGTKFESYINSAPVERKFDERQDNIDYLELERIMRGQ